MRRIAIWLMLLGLVFSAIAKEGNASSNDNDNAVSTKEVTTAEKPASTSAIELELQRQQALLQEQQGRIEALEAELNALRVRGAGSSTPAVTTSPNASEPPAVQPESEIAPSTPSVALKSAIAPDPQGEPKSPLSFKIGIADFTPGGFLDFTSFTRTTNVGSGIATSFGSIPFKNAPPQGPLTESRLSSQYSRLSLKVKADLTPSTTISGYVEGDFLGFQPANAYQTANSNSLRMRVYWADVRHGKWEILGGQEWSMLQPNRVGISPETPDVFYTLNEDPNFQVGLVWARQAQFRVVYHPTTSWALGISLENPDQFVPASVVFPNASFTTQFDNGSGSTSAPSSGTNTATPTLHPDLIVKTAFDSKIGGHAAHFEVAGIERSFRVFNPLLTTPTNSLVGGGGSVNFNVEIADNLRLIVNSFYSCGGGRYIFGLGPDVVVRANGTLACVHAGSGIGGFEWQTTPRFQFAGYYGGAYFQRNFDRLSATGTPTPVCAGISGFTCVGFGFPGSTNANRAIQEATTDLIYTMYSKPEYGKFQFMAQYSYLIRSPWSVAVGTPKNAFTNMIYLDLRYILP